jgi:monothiol glutaredoxin
MEKPKIIAYLKPFCGWSGGVRAVLRKYDLPFEDRDIWNDPQQRLEMIQKSGQELSPCVEVNGTMLADISGEELEGWLIKSTVVAKDNAPVGVPINAPCADHGEVVSTPITLKR